MNRIPWATSSDWFENKAFILSSSKSVIIDTTINVITLKTMDFALMVFLKDFMLSLNQNLLNPPNRLYNLIITSRIRNTDAVRRAKSITSYRSH